MDRPVAKLTREISAQVEETCRCGASEGAAALARALGVDVKLNVGTSNPVNAASLPQWMSGAGLVVVLTVGDEAALVLIAAQSGLVPSWCAQPDVTGQSKLATLAQELGMIFLPEAFMPDDSKTGYVKSLQGAAVRGGLAGEASLVPLSFELGDDQLATGALVWPATRPTMVLGAAASKPGSEPTIRPQTQVSPPAASSPHSASTPNRRAVAANSLPVYTRSLLRIKVPVVVTLARKRQSLGRVIELGTGSIIQFDKSCEELLELDVGGRPVAMGEVVKVGDKFGLRIKSVVLPNERFAPVNPQTT